MKELRKEIKEGIFHRVYLFFGDEPYQVAQAKTLLLNALVTEGDEMNYQAYASAVPDLVELRDYLMTFPFLAPKRVVLLDKTDIVKTGRDPFLKLLADIPESSVLILCEENVDKRGKVYKWIKANGYVREFTKKGMREADYLSFVGLILKKAGKKITRDDAALLVRKVGNDMFDLRNETEKLISYTGGRDTISRRDIEQSVHDTAEDRIFALVDAVAEKNKDKVLFCYQDLILLRESPLRILSLLIRHYRILLKIFDMSSQSVPGDEISRTLGIRPFVLTKSMRQLSSFREEDLLYCLRECLGTEENIKTGKISDRMGLESMLIELTQQ